MSIGYWMKWARPWQYYIAFGWLAAMIGSFSVFRYANGLDYLLGILLVIVGVTLMFYGSAKIKKPYHRFFAIIISVAIALSALAIPFSGLDIFIPIGLFGLFGFIIITYSYPRKL